MIKLKKRIINNKSLPFIIAELGINHQGSFKIAKKMAYLAIKNGADAIKNQTHLLDDEMINDAKKIKPENANKSIYNVIKSNYLKFEDEIKLKKFVESKGAIYLSTPFSLEAAKKLNSIKVKIFKIGSGECNNYPLIEEICKFRKPIIMSTGMNDLNSLKKSVKILEKYRINYALMHCVSEYPANYNHLKLDYIKKLKRNFPKALIGYSDHSKGIIPCFSAISKGAKIIEKHFTDTKKRNGPDIICSMDPKELNHLVQGSKIIYNSNGEDRFITNLEKKTAKFAFASVVSIKNIKKYEKLSKNNIWVKRPGTGDFLAEKYKYLIGKKVTNNIKSGQFIKKKDIKKR